MSARPCKACGMPIEFIEGPNGKPIPAQRIRTVYFRTDDYSRPLKRAQLGPEGTSVEFYVSHWETCPGADQIKRSQGK